MTRPLTPAWIAAGAVIIAASTGCARGRAVRAAAPDDLRPALDAARRAIAVARTRLDSALAASSPTAALRASATDAVELRRGATVIARGRDALTASLDAMGTRGGPGDLVLLSRATGVCRDGGYETGSYTQYVVDATGNRTGTPGAYAIAWSVRDTVATVRSIVLEPGGEMRGVPREIACTTDATLRQRASRVSVTASTAYTKWPALGSLRTTAARAGWTTNIGGRRSDGRGCDAGADASSVLDQQGLQLSARVRVRERVSAEIVSVPLEIEQCVRQSNPATGTAVTQAVGVSDQTAFVNYVVGSARIGAGLSYTRVRVRAFEDSVGVFAYNRVGSTTSGGALGVAAQAAYTLGITSRLYLETSGRVRAAPGVARDRLLRYQPGPVSTAGFALSLGAGMSF